MNFKLLECFPSYFGFGLEKQRKCWTVLAAMESSFLAVHTTVKSKVLTLFPIFVWALWKPQNNEPILNWTLNIFAFTVYNVIYRCYVLSRCCFTIFLIQLILDLVISAIPTRGNLLCSQKKKTTNKFTTKVTVRGRTVSVVDHHSLFMRARGPDTIESFCFNPRTGEQMAVVTGVRHDTSWFPRCPGLIQS